MHNSIELKEYNYINLKIIKCFFDTQKCFQYKQKERTQSYDKEIFGVSQSTNNMVLIFFCTWNLIIFLMT